MSSRHHGGDALVANRANGGAARIRTSVPLAGETVFETAAIGRSATAPDGDQARDRSLLLVMGGVNPPSGPGFLRSRRPPEHEVGPHPAPDGVGVAIPDLDPPAAVCND